MANESGHVTHFRQKHIKPEEHVIAFGDGYIGDLLGTGANRQQNGSLLVTNLRVVFVKKGLFGEIIETIPLKSITSIERKSLLGMRRIEIHTSHDSLKFKTQYKKAEQEMVDAIENYREAKVENMAHATTQPKSAKERLAELKELLDDGFLSEDEFAQQKSKILGEI